MPYPLSTSGAAPTPVESLAQSKRPPEEAMHFLYSREGESRREGRRITFGLASLVLIAVATLNLGIYRSASQKLEQEGRARLASSVDSKRDQVVRILDTIRREARSVTEDPQVAGVASAIASGRASAAERERLAAELGRSAALFGFRDIQVVAADGRYLIGISGAPEPDEVARHRDLVRAAREAGAAVLGDPHGQILTLAVPSGRDVTDRAEPVLLFHVDASRSLTPMLASWPGLGSTASGFLTRFEGPDVVLLTDPFQVVPARGGERLAASAAAALPASMAAAAVESDLDAVNTAGERIWVATRHMPELGWGLVGSVQRAPMMATIRGTLAGLLLLDFALLASIAGMTWTWRRHFRARLKQREREVTERHMLRVQAIFDTAFDAIVTFGNDGRIRSINRAGERLFGRSASELVGVPFAQYVAWGEGPKDQALPETGAVASGEVTRPDASLLPVEFSLGTAGEHEDLLHTAIIRDVTERVRAESRIRTFAEGLELTNRRLEEANAQLEEVSRLKSEFLANTSHELRTPLNGMIGFLQLVLDDMCESREEERDFQRQALQCSRHLLGLINDVLDIAKIESGKLALEVEPIDVPQLFDEVYTVTHVQAQQKGLALHFDAGMGSGARGRGDFGKIKQVLINLVGNSLKFTSKGGIEVRARAHEAIGHVMFEVVDTGIGIPPDRQGVIFDKFVQADGSTTRKFGGTGLGLAISKSLVERMGGVIGVHSEGVGHGTRMYFSLPLWRETIAEPEDVGLVPARRDTSGPVPGPGDGALVLIVEDDPVFRRFLTAVLRQHGYRTLEAADADGGWRQARSSAPDVVVLDYALSCSDESELRTGWDLAQRMTTDSRTRHVPLVFVTGFDGEIQQKLQATAFARRPEHLVKPIEAPELIDRIERLVDRVAGRPVRVLMADDDPTVAAYVRRVLPAERFRLQVARDGEECLHVLRTQAAAFDLLLLDLMMPEVSGYDVLRELTMTGMHPDMPVLILTNFPEARNEEERRLLERGLVLDVISKSSVHEDPKRLSQVIDWHLQSGGRRDDSRREAA